MSDIYPDDSKRRATGTKPTDTERACVQYGLLGPCVAFALFDGVGVGHYAASVLANKSGRSLVREMPVFCSISATRSAGTRPRSHLHKAEAVTPIIAARSACDICRRSRY